MRCMYRIPFRGLAVALLATGIPLHVYAANTIDFATNAAHHSDERIIDGGRLRIDGTVTMLYRPDFRISADALNLQMKKGDDKEIAVYATRAYLAARRETLGMAKSGHHR